MEAMRAQSEIRCSQLEMETAVHGARSAMLATARSTLDGTTVVEVRRREADGYFNPYAHNAAAAFQF